MYNNIKGMASNCKDSIKVKANSLWLKEINHQFEINCLNEKCKDFDLQTNLNNIDINFSWFPLDHQVGKEGKVVGVNPKLKPPITNSNKGDLWAMIQLGSP